MQTLTAVDGNMAKGQIFEIYKGKNNEAIILTLLITTVSYNHFESFEILRKKL